MTAPSVTRPGGDATPADLVARIEQAMLLRLGDIPDARGRGFVSSELLAVHAALRSVLDRDLARGPVFCDWGSGLGAVCALAASLAFRAYGIEIQADFVAASRALVADLGLEASFALGTFVRPGDEDLIAGEDHVSLTTAPDAYRALGLLPEQIDVVFAYPWPGEEELVDRLFGRHAPPGSLLLTYHECSRVLVQRRNDDAEELQSLGWMEAPVA
ncbi:MAG: methyltransferase domain-containing protein [Planctomycetota bacterium]|jgi:hypothetical protein